MKEAAEDAEKSVNAEFAGPPAALFNVPPDYVRRLGGPSDPMMVLGP